MCRPRDLFCHYLFSFCPVSVAVIFLCRLFQQESTYTMNHVNKLTSSDFSSLPQKSDQTRSVQKVHVTVFWSRMGTTQNFYPKWLNPMGLINWLIWSVLIPETQWTLIVVRMRRVIFWTNPWEIFVLELNGVNRTQQVPAKSEEEVANTCCVCLVWISERAS